VWEANFVNGVILSGRMIYCCQGKEARKNRGPEAEVLKLDGDLGENVKKAMQKPKPTVGLPK
jgi:hypothetical protein